jgi:membrane protein
MRAHPRRDRLSEDPRARDAQRGTEGPQAHHLHFLDLIRGPGHRFRTFWARLYWKADEDNIFFLAGAISFNVVVAFVPLILLLVGLAGYLLSARFGDPGEVITGLLLGALPELDADSSLVGSARSLVDGILDGRRELSLVGGALLLWLSTRLVGTLRTALREVFDIAHGRSIVRGKFFDAQMVVVGGALFLLNMSITVVVRTVRDLGVEVLGLEGTALQWGDRALAAGLAFTSIWALFLLIYRYLPARRIPWRTALIAATVMAITFEVLKSTFSWYVTSVADYTSTYGNLATLAVLFFWVYYSSIAFVLAGEIAQVATMRRAWKLRPVARGATGVGLEPTPLPTSENSASGR